MPYSLLGKGFLTGKIEVGANFSRLDLRSNIPRFEKAAIEANQAMVELIRAIGECHGATPAQVALALLLARKPWIVPLFGTRKLERFD